MFIKQVDKNHYNFNRYMSKSRWGSLWHQIYEVSKDCPGRVLEIGPGMGLLKLILGQIGIAVDTLDIDIELRPDLVASAASMPFSDNTYDTVCAFQMLEHLPYRTSIDAFREMLRVSKNKVIISLPDASIRYRISLQFPILGTRNLFYPKPVFKNIKHVFDGEHYWEINKQGYELKKIIGDFSEYAKLEGTYRVEDNMYHRFFIFNK